MAWHGLVESNGSVRETKSIDTYLLKGKMFLEEQKKKTGTGGTRARATRSLHAMCLTAVAVSPLRFIYDHLLHTPPPAPSRRRWPGQP
jgi:hypothetical protein